MLLKKQYCSIACVAVIMVLSISFISCKGLTTGKSSVDSDSIKQAKEAQIMLPDTVFESAADVEYEVELLDSATSGQLTSLLDPYDSVPGILTFRGGHRRDARKYSGKVKGTPSRIVQDWATKTDARGKWGGGTGWSGQPVYAKWTNEQLAHYRKTSPGVTQHLNNEEIMVGSLCGKVYFIDYATGQFSRQPIDVMNPLKGSMGLDPAMNGSLYVGQGYPDHEPIGHLAIDLDSHKQVYMWGRDPKAKRNWNTYDSSPIIAGQFMFWCGENGTVYKYERLGNGKLKMHSALRYVIKGDHGAGIESSIAIYKNYGFIGDNHGDVLCINLNNMKPVWHYDNHDDIDGSIVVEVENGIPYLYCGCEVDLQSGPDKRTHFVKLNGLNGSKVWEWSCPSEKVNIRNAHFDGGLYCTPLLGDGNCKDMIFASFNQLDGKKTSEFLAFDKKTGQVLYRKPLDFFAWSSPVGFYNEKKELFIVIGNSNGHLYMFNGKTGDMLFDQVMSSNFESSPVVINNTLVVGARDGNIYRFHVE